MKRTKYDELGKTLRKLEKQQEEKKKGDKRLSNQIKRRKKQTFL